MSFSIDCIENDDIKYDLIVFESKKDCCCKHNFQNA